jgi:hypothetical protein
MRLVELPRPKPTVRITPPSDDPDADIPVLADFPTDIPVNPPPKRPPAERTESDEGHEPSDNETGSPQPE